MKILKLILVFVIVLGGVVGAFFLSGGSTNSGLNDPSDDTYQTYRTQFENDWKDKGDWSDSLFRAHCDMVRQLSLEYNVTPLKDLNTTTAVEVVFDKIFEEWSSISCKKATVEYYITALDTIQAEDENATSNPNVQKIKSVNETYKRAYALAHKTIGLTPGFDGTSWRSFSSYSNSVLSEKNSILNDANYKQYLANIRDIKNGLNAIPSKLDNAKTRFYNNLASAIVSRYRDIEPSSRTRSQLNELREVRNKFNNEAPTSSIYLNKFCNTFADDVDRNESNENNQAF